MDDTLVLRHDGGTVFLCTSTRPRPVFHFTGLRLARLGCQEGTVISIKNQHSMLRCCEKKLTAQLVSYEKGIRLTVRWLRHFICIVWRKRGR
jgi:hypothetical protein